MAKLLKILGRTVGSIFEWSVIFIIVLAFAIRTSPVQTYLAGQATDYLSEELGAEVKIDKVHIVFLDRAALDGVLVRDESGDTLLYAKRIIINVKDYSIRKKYYTIGSADIEEAFVHIQRSKDNVFNHAFIRDYFLLKKKKRKKNKIKFKLNQASFSNSRFRFDDNRKPYREKGMDYFHLNAVNVNGSVSNIKIVKDVITANVDWINLKEKCGFVLKDLNTTAEISPRGLLMKDLEITSEDSYVMASQMNMHTEHYNGFRYFVDSVSFEGKIDKSDLSLKEVAYFAYALDGMDDRVRLTTEVHRKVKDLKLKNFDLRFKDKTQIKGTIRLDDYREFDKGFFHEKLNYTYVDFDELESLRLPNSASTDYLTLSPKIKGLGYVKAHEITLDGSFREFVVASRLIETRLGGANIDNGILFTENPKNGSYYFKKSYASAYDVKVNNFNLGAYLNNKDIGAIDGKLFLAGEVFSDAKINFSEISGDVNRFDYLDYPYQNITINEGSYQDQIFTGQINVNDHNLSLTYNGFIDFKGNQHMHFSVDLGKALLHNLHLTTLNCKLLSKLEFDIYGKEMNTFDGDVLLRDLKFEADGELISVDSLDFKVSRSRTEDVFEISSNIGYALVRGKVNFNHLVDDLNYQISKIFPSLYTEKQDKFDRHNEDNFRYVLRIEDANDFLKIFYKEIKIAPFTWLQGSYNGKSSNFRIEGKSDYFQYEDLEFTGLKLNQIMDSTGIIANLEAKRFNYNDSLSFTDIHFNTTGAKNELFHNLSWEQGINPSSLISWETTVHASDHYALLLNPSYFFVNNKKWNIEHESSVRFDSDTIAVDNFELKRNDQHIAINGQISDNRGDKLNFVVRDFELGEISSFITSDYPMTGLINSTGFISNPFKSLGFRSEGSLTDFTVKGHAVGDIQIKTAWNKRKQAIQATGDLTYIDEKTFDFKGDYFVDRKENNLDFDLNFDYTDLQFTNAFMDPDVLSEIRGLLHGKIHLTGSPAKPILEGTAGLAAGSAYMDMLGIHIGVDGPIKVDEYGFYINSIPVFDEEGNSGNLIGSVFHENFQDFNFDLQFDLETNLNADPFMIPGVVSANKFLVMDLPYSPDVLYYGKGYVTGIANIFGYTDNLEITVDFKTESGTTVNIPMYGIGEIEEEGFITFVDHSIDSTSMDLTPKFDLTGVDLDLNFQVTPDADINIIFNEDLGDVISAKGNGDISISLDNLGDVKMEGVYTVLDGVYNFAMDPISKNAIAIKQKFIIDEGGSISWKGDPYDADLDLRTHYVINANIAEISNDQFGSGTGAHQPVLSYLELSGTMTSPSIGFDIEAPQADELGRSLINRITSDPDELNRQFFSLMLFRRFQPIDAGAAGGSGALGLIANQINYLLASVSSEYNLNLDFDTDQLTGDNTLEFGISKGFLDDRLLLSGSFGIENYGEDAHITDANGNELDGQLVGDVKVEYLLNENGSFRVNIFNESTDKTVIQESELAPFTQGAGLLYKEDFNTFEDFKLIQYVFDIFRKKENKRYPDKRKRQQRKVPDDEAIEESSDPIPVTENN